MLNLLGRRPTKAPATAAADLKRTVKALVFDLDGTLCDSLAEIKAACDHTLWALEKRPPFPLENYALFAGNGNRLLLARVLMAADLRARGEMAPVSTALQMANPNDDAERVARAVVLKMQFEDEQSVEGKSQVEAFPGALEMLQAAAAKGLKIAVLSNKTQVGVSRTVGAAFGGIAFEDVIGAVDGAPPPKPEPATLLGLVANMGLTPRDCVMIGDTDVDMKTAVNAGAHGIGVTWGFRDAAELKESGAEFVVKSFAELQKLLL
jgi:phosphoglycolate phosphatase